LVLVALAACHAVRDPPVRSHPRAGAGSMLDSNSIDVYWIGHATVLVRMGDRWILTDPNFSTRIGGLVRRYVRPGVAIDDLPDLDWVVVSHAHADHLDIPSLRKLPARARARASLVIPPGVADLIPASVAFPRTFAVSKWRSVEADGVRVTAVPARHADARWVIDELWRHDAHTGYVIEYGALTVYFAGDTGYDRELFATIGERFDIDVALIPVGPANRPGWVHRLRRHVHVDPDEALAIFDDVGAQWMVPIHYGTFFKADAGERRAIRAAIDRHPRARAVRMLTIGDSTTFHW
jgi:L-ascorbate metabolism protein UlaG (beta-lactamase superfamily)